MKSEKFAAAIEKTLNFQLSTLNFFVPLRQNYSEMDTIKKQFAQKLMDIKAIKLQPNEPFTWASGWKSPIYTDNRKTLGFADVRSFVKLELCHAIQQNFPEAEAVAGVATGAIAQGALVADELGLPYAYVRPKPKDHGMGNQVEGELKKGAKVIVVEDLISTGGSSAEGCRGPAPVWCGGHWYGGIVHLWFPCC